MMPTPKRDGWVRARTRVYVSLAILVGISGGAFALFSFAFSIPGAGMFFVYFFAVPIGLVPMLRALFLISGWMDVCLVLATTALGLWGGLWGASKLVAYTDPYDSGSVSAGPVVLGIVGLLLPLIVIHLAEFWRLRRQGK
jgi:hypothetical protein